MLSYDFFKDTISHTNHTNQQKFLALVQNGIQASNSTQS